MHEGLSLITTIAASFALALMLGLVATRLKLPTLVGYLLSGIVITALPGVAVDLSLSQQLADIGIILLMFGVGLHFSLKDLLQVRRLVIPGALSGILIATLLGLSLARWWQWPWSSALVFGLCLSVASTVVMMRALDQQGILKSVNGHIAMGWLIVEDMALVLVLVLLPPLSGHDAAADAVLWQSVLLTLLKVGIFLALMHIVGRRVFPQLLAYVAGSGSRELFTLTVFAVAIGIAFASSQFFGVSIALGAFFAGMVMRESPLSHRAANESLPLRDAFSVLFFVSVGMLFDASVLLDKPLQVLALVAIILLAKPVGAFVLISLYRYPLTTGLTVAAGLSQIGEFSFILAALGRELELLPADAMSLILAASLITISINTFVFRAIEPLQRWIREQRPLVRLLERSDDPLAELPMTVGSHEVTGHIVLVGYGRVGGRIGKQLLQQGRTFVVAEQNREVVEKLRAHGVKAVAGDAAEPAVLIQAHVARAAILVITLPDTLHVPHMVEVARMLNPNIEVHVRANSEEAAELLAKANVGDVYLGEAEVARSIAEKLLAS